MKFAAFACAALVLATVPARRRSSQGRIIELHGHCRERTRARVERQAIAWRQGGHARPPRAHRRGADAGNREDDDRRWANRRLVMKADEVLLQPAGKHATANATTTPIDVVIVELKGPSGSASFPATRPGMKTTTVLDDPRARAVRASFEPTFHEAAGTTHDSIRSW